MPKRKCSATEGSEPKRFRVNLEHTQKSFEELEEIKRLTGATNYHALRQAIAIHARLLHWRRKGYDIVAQKEDEKVFLDFVL